MYRTVIMLDGGKTECVIYESKDFEECLARAQAIIAVGTDMDKVDILCKNSAGTWVSFDNYAEG